MRSEEGLNLILHLLEAVILFEVRVAVLVDLCQKPKLLMEHLSCLVLVLLLCSTLIRCIVLAVYLDQAQKVHAELFALIQIESMLVDEKLEQLLYLLIRYLAAPNAFDQGALRFPSTRLHRIHVEASHGQEGVKNFELSRYVSDVQCGTEQVIVIRQI